MKLHPLPLLALAGLLAGCSSFRVHQPELVGTVSTPWGVLPAYDQTGHAFRNLDKVKPGTPLKGTATVAILVNRDGTVKDAVVVESTGDDLVKQAALLTFRPAHYSLHLRPEQAAPYVVIETVTYDPANLDNQYVNYAVIDRGSPVERQPPPQIHPVGQAALNQARAQRP